MAPALQGLWLAGVPHSLTLGCGRWPSIRPRPVLPWRAGRPGCQPHYRRRATIDGRPCRFDANEGANTLHSGAYGLHRRIWQVAGSVRHCRHFRAGSARRRLGGFPGNRRLSARYSLHRQRHPAAGAITATTDAPTPINIANHSYWNLDGAPTWSGHSLQIEADHWLPVDTDQIPTGRIAPATGAMDFRRPRPLGPDAPALDHNFCLAADRRALAEAATLTGASGLPGCALIDHRAGPAGL